MNQVLNEAFAAYEQHSATYDTISSAPLTANQASRFPYADAVIAGIRRADLLDDLAAEPPSSAQLGQFSRWLHGRGILAGSR